MKQSWSKKKQNCLNTSNSNTLIYALLKNAQLATQTQKKTTLRMI